MIEKMQQRRRMHGTMTNKIEKRKYTPTRNTGKPKPDHYGKETRVTYEEKKEPVNCASDQGGANK